MSVSTRTRFEVLKRDGFQCYYCGATSESSRLHVDHVIPRARGGADALENLVAACEACNLGKSAVPLSDIVGAVDSTRTEKIKAHARAVHEHMEACRLFEAELAEACTWLQTTWEQVTRRSVPTIVINHSRAIVTKYSTDNILTAMQAVARKRGLSSSDCSRYFYGVLRNLNAEAS